MTSARIAAAAGIELGSPLPDPVQEAQDLVPYDEDARQVLERAFEVAIAEGADMVDVPHLVEALRSGSPASR